MSITVRYFASIREAIGLGSETVQTGQTTLKGLRDELLARGGVYAEVLSRDRVVRMAVNQVMCDESQPLPILSEVAFFPPVTGG